MARKLTKNQKRYAEEVAKEDYPLKDHKLWSAYQRVYQTKNMDLVKAKVKELKKIPQMKELIAKLREGKRGRPTGYKAEYCHDIVEFFNRPPFEIRMTKNDAGEEVPAIAPNGQPVMIPCELPTLAAFALKIGVHVNTLLNWQNTHPDFLGAYKHAKEIQEHILIQNGLMRNYDSAFARFLATNITSMTEQKEVKVASYEIPKDATDEDASRAYEDLLKGG